MRREDTEQSHSDTAQERDSRETAAENKMPPIPLRSLKLCFHPHGKALSAAPNVARQRPRASGVQHETERSSRGSLHALGSAPLLLTGVRLIACLFWYIV